MNLYRMIIRGQDDVLIRAEDFIYAPNSGMVKFKRGNENVAIFQLENIVGLVKVKEDGDQ